MQAAAKMSTEDRQAMIRGMVDSLAARLEQNPNDREGWVRLARSYEVLNEPDKAKQAWARAEAVPAGTAPAPAPPPPVGCRFNAVLSGRTSGKHGRRLPRGGG